jgi:hypothetical protein
MLGFLILLKILMRLKLLTLKHILIKNNFLYNKFKIKYLPSKRWSGGVRRDGVSSI